MLTWLIDGGVGPALVGIPVNWGANALAEVAKRWFRRFRQTDDLSRLVRAATNGSVDLTRSEVDAVGRLLEEPQTWKVAGRGTLDDLAGQIAASLPVTEARSAADSLAAARIIARGLLEFAVADLEPKVFQQLLLARIDRLETDQASALDEALIGLHADLAAYMAAEFDIDSQRSAQIMAQLTRTLDRLPPCPADRREMAAYLKILIDWLNVDPWPRDHRFDGPVLAPAAIERRLRITTSDRLEGHDLDADDLASSCRRLVILGGPGTGKTWLAKRTARRCAENALNALSRGSSLDDVEFPLYTTCSRLFSAEGGIREATVSAALDHLSDLGGARLNAAVREFFAERNTSVLLVIDSLDEAQGPDDRLRQADTLPWRIVLTTRPSSWNRELNLDDRNDAHRIGELQPLRYPEDVWPFIDRWFADRKAWGERLTAQISERPALQQAATVPLLLAFYCIIGGRQSLPDFRRDVYSRVLNRLLTGRWRGSRANLPDAQICLEVLRDWAWRGATCSELSGIGTWQDDVVTERCQIGDIEEGAVNHVAPPMAPVDIDTGRTMRRFVHRSVREHLVAEYVASLPADQAVDVLLPHLWYDADWQYAASAALAMHPEHDKLLRSLIFRAIGSDQVTEAISIVEVQCEFREFLARVASESREHDWSPEIAAMIGDARVELAQAARVAVLGGAESWETSNRRARSELLALLDRSTNGWSAAFLIDGFLRLQPTAADKRRACDAMLGLLGGVIDGEGCAQVVRCVIQLARNGDKRHAREALLALLTSDESGAVSAELASGIMKLGAATAVKREIRNTLLGLLVGQDSARVAARLVTEVVRLCPSSIDRREAREALLMLLNWQADTIVAGQLVAGLVQLAHTGEDRRDARKALLKIMARQASGWATAALADGVAKLAPTPAERQQARGVLLGMLAGRVGGTEAFPLATAVMHLAPSAADRKWACNILLGLLATETDGWVAARLVSAMMPLRPTATHMRQARNAIFRLLAIQTDSWAAQKLVDEIVNLTQDPAGMLRARKELLALLAAQTNVFLVENLIAAVLRLEPTAIDKRAASQALLDLLARRCGDRFTAGRAVDLLIQVVPASDLRDARQGLLKLLTRVGDSSVAAALAGGVAQLNPTAADKRQARGVLLKFLTPESSDPLAAALAMTHLDPSAADRRRATESLLRLLARQTGSFAAAALAMGVQRIAPEPGYIQQACDYLFDLLTRTPDRDVARELMRMAARLAPTVGQLSTWRTWAVPPTEELLAAVRANTTLTDWLDALPDLALLSTGSA